MAEKHTLILRNLELQILDPRKSASQNIVNICVTVEVRWWHILVSSSWPWLGLSGVPAHITCSVLCKALAFKEEFMKTEKVLFMLHLTGLTKNRARILFCYFDCLVIFFFTFEVFPSLNFPISISSRISNLWLSVPLHPILCTNM